ncbi:MAG: hypothetical protein HOD11_07970 [Candidatus Marinimicrobia bacterium]|nr:hypothetical protein [Candidatus Neomarinimicrobiota bacterium]
MSNGSKRLVGKSGLYSGDYNGAITVGAFCSIYRSTSKIVKHVLKSLQYKRYLHVLLAGTNINNLKNADMDNLTFLLPTDETETRQISYFLDVIEGKILQCRNNIESFSKFKKGLLQQMFV